MIEDSTIEHLYIGQNYFSNKVAQDFFKHLSGNKHLRVLDYSLNQLGEDNGTACPRAIAACLVKNRTLEHLDLSFNNFSKEDTEIIAEGLRSNHRIYGFHYRGNIGYVNSKGFLVLEEREITSRDTFDNPKFNAF